MDILTITVTNNNEPDCQRMTVINHHDIPVTGHKLDFITRAIKEAEQELRDLFPRGMTYTQPYTVIEITRSEVLARRELERASAEEAVR